MIFIVVPWLYLGNSQVSVYRTIGPTLVVNSLSFITDFSVLTFIMSFMGFLINKWYLAYFCREGILFSLTEAETVEGHTPPPNLAFLEVLCEFTNKLMKQDKKTVYVLLVSLLIGRGQHSTP